MKYIGIDPGKSGSVTVIEGESLRVTATPVIGKEYNVRQMFTLLDAEKNNAVAILERAQAMPRQGVVSMFEFGRGYGIWIGLLSALNLPFRIVHSRVWTRMLLMGAPGEGKERAFFVARNLFPQWNPKLKKEYQFCDSILLAEYGRRIYTNNQL